MRTTPGDDPLDSSPAFDAAEDHVPPALLAQLRAWSAAAQLPPGADAQIRARLCDALRAPLSTTTPPRSRRRLWPVLVAGMAATVLVLVVTPLLDDPHPAAAPAAIRSMVLLPVAAGGAGEQATPTGRWWDRPPLAEDQLPRLPPLRSPALAVVATLHQGRCLWLLGPAVESPRKDTP